MTEQRHSGICTVGATHSVLCMMMEDFGPQPEFDKYGPTAETCCKFLQLLFINQETAEVLATFANLI